MDMKNQDHNQIDSANAFKVLPPTAYQNSNCGMQGQTQEFFLAGARCKTIMEEGANVKK